METQISVWCNKDGMPMCNYIKDELEKIYQSTELQESVTAHDIEDLIEKATYNQGFGALVFVISFDTLKFIEDYPQVCLDHLSASVRVRFYVIYGQGILKASFEKFLGTQNEWKELNLSEYKGAASKCMRDVVEQTLSINNDVIRRTPGRMATIEKKGSFKIIPNVMQLGKGLIQEGTIVILPAVEKLSWRYSGSCVTAFIAYQDSQRIPLTLIPEAKPYAFSFFLPEGLKPGKYMVHVKDGPADSPSRELGNRKLTLLSSAQYISANTFTEEFICSLCKVSDMKSKPNIEKADEILADRLAKNELPLSSPTNPEFPTILHMACKFGLNNLTTSIIDNFSSSLQQLASVENGEGKTALQLALEGGFKDMKEMIQNQLVLEDKYIAHDPFIDQFICADVLSAQYVDGPLECEDDATYLEAQVPVSNGNGLKPISRKGQGKYQTLPNTAALRGTRKDGLYDNNLKMRSMMRSMRGMSIDKRIQIQRDALKSNTSNQLNLSMAVAGKSSVDSKNQTVSQVDEEGEDYENIPSLSGQKLKLPQPMRRK